MATKAHCAYVFECLAAAFEKQQPLSLVKVEQLWYHYHATKVDDEDDVEGGGEDENEDESDEEEMTEAETNDSPPIRPAAVSRLQNKGTDSSATSSNSSLPLSTNSTSSSTPSSRQSGSGITTPASSRTSLGSTANGRPQRREFPLFVTWNTVSRSGYKSLRGCIGTFEAQELEYGLHSYALTSAFEDIRFSPIPPTLLSSLSAHVTLLNNFSQPTKDPLDWTIGKHGIRISFTINGRRYGSTYLPDVAKEQGWNQEEAIVSLMRKAGWNGSSSSWAKTWKDGRGELVRYEGEQVGLEYAEWKEWKEWVG
ncbi:hypothetical protein LTR78_002718 [Recurvomyces mirabilis]|uniref:AMMECR1 domain-containing protein n=1 Tax=Recurvomyces mirabilis TaxID=574656 RepID=A0AAE0WSV9_9PEZI|nr:hypothetical protein LTR78_002718 [Recurvomyces mirabilis]KAK5159548.1 hypothetical protein LTS14_002690 [Recurvomyces mirabilis]